MTREEAIKYLSEEIEKTKAVVALTERDFGVSESVWHTETAAFELAISALREQEEYEIQRHLKHFDIKEPRPEAVTKCHDLYDENGGEILEQDSLEKKTSDKKTSEWISVEERLPELESFVLCKLKGFQYGGNIQVCRYRTADKYVDHPYFDHYRNGFPHVTHWMPLPEPPTEDMND